MAYCNHFIITGAVDCFIWRQRIGAVYLYYFLVSVDSVYSLFLYTTDSFF